MYTYHFILILISLILPQDWSVFTLSRGRSSIHDGEHVKESLPIRKTNLFSIAASREFGCVIDESVPSIKLLDSSCQLWKRETTV